MSDSRRPDPSGAETTMRASARPSATTSSDQAIHRPSGDHVACWTCAPSAAASTTATGRVASGRSTDIPPPSVRISSVPGRWPADRGGSTSTAGAGSSVGAGTTMGSVGDGVESVRSGVVHATSRHATAPSASRCRVIRGIGTIVRVSGWKIAARHPQARWMT